VSDRARALSVEIAAHVGLVGLLAVELFDLGDRVVVNELAARPHNSGHLTIEACVTSQFEQHLRAVLGLPLGDARAVAPHASMVNLVGPPDGSEPAERLASALAVPGARVHLYGKAPRPGRKLGHVTAVGPEGDRVRATAWAAAAALAGRVEQGVDQP
jgi:5-(carboxyamino)imidazole ribonucleotide synthase